jgi:hypothetical protein
VVGAEDSDTRNDARTVYASPAVSGMNIGYAEVPGSHDWQCFTAALTLELPWLGQRLGLTTAPLNANPARQASNWSTRGRHRRRGCDARPFSFPHFEPAAADSGARDSPSVHAVLGTSGRDDAALGVVSRFESRVIRSSRLVVG